MIEQNQYRVFVTHISEYPMQLSLASGIGGKKEYLTGRASGILNKFNFRTAAEGTTSAFILRRLVAEKSQFECIIIHELVPIPDDLPVNSTFQTEGMMHPKWRYLGDLWSNNKLWGFSRCRKQKAWFESWIGSSLSSSMQFCSIVLFKCIDLLVLCWAGLPTTLRCDHDSFDTTSAPQRLRLIAVLAEKNWSQSNDDSFVALLKV